MTEYVAMLRGVNVGGVKVAMADLRAVGEGAGFSSVRTHVNSGNLLYSAERGSPAEHARTLTGLLADAVGREVPIVVRTAPQLQAAADAAVEQFPGVEPVRIAIAFLDRQVPEKSGGRLGEWEHEQYQVRGGEVLLHYSKGQARSKLTLDVIEKRLGVVATVRGLGTVRGLLGKMGSP